VLPSALQNVLNLCQKLQPIIITTGFIAANSQGNVTTLGRGGSDLSASLFGVALDANIQIWTDVPGVMTCDPKITPNARLVPFMTLTEAYELSFYGAKVLHPKTIEPLLQKPHLTLQVLNTFQPSHVGTLISRDRFINYGKPIAISLSKENVIVHLSDIQNFYKVFEIFSKHHIQLSMLSTSKSSVSFALSKVSNLNYIMDSLSETCSVYVQEGFSVISIVGEGLKNTIGIASRVFQAAAKLGVNIEMISQSSGQVNISIAVSNTSSIPLIQQLHHEFFEKTCI
jgi:aspartate kinase